MRIENTQDMIKILRQCEERAFQAQLKIQDIKLQIQSLINVEHEWHNCPTDLDDMESLISTHSDLMFAMRSIIHRSIEKLGGDW